MAAKKKRDWWYPHMVPALNLLLNLFRILHDLDKIRQPLFHKKPHLAGWGFLFGTRRKAGIGQQNLCKFA
jgi:hypothetical protein